MNTQGNSTHSASIDALGKVIASRLTEGSESLPREITERLKVARVQAVAKRRMVSEQAQVVVASGGEAILQLGDDDGGWFNRIASLLPLIALIAGLFSIASLQDENRATEIAEVDAALLIDELPPQAYVDPGFAQYLRENRQP